MVANAVKQEACWSLDISFQNCFMSLMEIWVVYLRNISSVHSMYESDHISLDTLGMVSGGCTCTVTHLAYPRRG
ncbi:hypothetical protein VNO77_40915 [Canavalia gladiata]|uniref:Uncharacterized protein n=1 Tax=Canavalia gladiata TaxID=3824 RepID=A0AAN9K0G4_CANGL